MKIKISLKTKKAIALVTVMLIVLIGCLSTYVYKYEYEKSFEREAVSLSGYYNDVCNNLLQKNEFYKELVKTTNDRYFIRLQMILDNVSQLTAESIESLVQDNSDDYDYTYGFYSLDDDLNVTFERAHSHLSLLDSELDQLLSEGKFVSSDICYVSRKVDGGYHVLAQKRNLKIISDLDYDLTKLSNYIIVDNNTGRVIDHNSNQPFADVGSLTMTDFHLLETKTVKDIEVRKVECQGSVFLTIYGSFDLDEYGNVTVSVFVEDGACHRHALFSAICFATFIILFAYCCVFLLYRLQRKKLIQENEEPQLTLTEEETLELYKHYLKSAMATIVICFSIVSTLFFSIQNILEIDKGIVTAFNNLSLLNKGYNENQIRIAESATEAGMEYMNDMVDALVMEYNTDVDEWLKEKADILDAERINLYDKNGTIVNSSSVYYKGYSLTKNESDTEYGLWQLLNGSAESLVLSSEDNSIAYLAKRRVDDVGILEIVTEAKGLMYLLEKTEFAELLKSQDYPNTDRYYYYRNNPETLYILEAGNAIEKTTTNVFPQVEPGKIMSGIVRIDGTHYLYINSGNEEWVSIFAYPVNDLILSSLRYFTFFVISYCLVAAALLYFFRKNKYKFNENIETTASTSDDIGFELKRAITTILSLLAITVLAMFIIKNYYISDTGLLMEFLDGWQKGLNYISFLYLLLALIVVVGLVLLVGLLNSLLCKLMPPKGATISTLLANIIKVVIAVVFLIDVLDQLGVNATAITASLGLTGLALSMGSKEIVSDLIAGLSIAFEGQLQIGDYVEVDKFFGVIESLGIRTTKIKLYNKQLIVNNSNLKNIINYSRGKTSMFTIPFSLPINTNLDYLSQVIEESKERLKNACDGKLIGDVFLHGVSTINKNSVDCTFKGVAAVNDANYCCAKASTELAKILQEKGFYANS